MRIIKGLLKTAAAGIAAVAIVSGLMFFYNISPVHEVNPRGNTDYVWPANSFWVKATEGLAFGKFDANGFNNKTVPENPDILVVGSSHIEAMNVMQDENAAYLLSEKLRGRYTVYNMGMSDHNIFRTSQYLPADLELFDPVPGLLIIETSNVILSGEKVDEVVSASVERVSSHSTGIVGFLQKIPFIRTVYHQVAGGLLDLFMPGSGSSAAGTDKDAEIGEGADAQTGVDKAAYGKYFSFLKETEEKYGTQILFFYHPTGTLQEDGTIAYPRDEYLDAFGAYAKEYGITFVDMTERFEKLYYEEHHTAHGFCNGRISSGHLNKYGHAAVAEVLYNEINRMEEAGELCR